MTREEAEIVVAPYVSHIGKMKGVRHDIACNLLGEVDYERMMKNPVRNLGPDVSHVYPWNVIDYLSGYRTPREKLLESQGEAK